MSDRVNVNKLREEPSPPLAAYMGTRWQWVRCSDLAALLDVAEAAREHHAHLADCEKCESEHCDDEWRLACRLAVALSGLEFGDTT